MPVVGARATMIPWGAEESRARAQPVARGIRAGWWRTLEAGALIYILMISSGMFGFIDILAFGDLYTKQDSSQFAQVLWPVAYLLFAGLTLAVWRDVLGIVRRHRWILVFPIVVAASCLWSRDPAATFDGAIRVGMTTLIGIYLGTRFDLHELARAVFAVMLVAVGGSILAGLAGTSYALMGEDGSLRGLFHHKNTLGSRAALLFGTSIALLIAGWRPHLALLGLGLALVAAVMSHSATSVALAGLSVAVLPLAIVLRSRWSTLIYGLILLGAAFSLIAFLVVFLRIDPVVEVLGALGRDLTFTGRILLWDAALDYIRARPLLGTGFDAFWSGRLDWRILLVLEELGNVLHFHNSLLEVGVQLGAIGLVAALLTVVGYGRAALMALRLRVDPLATWPTIYGAILLAVAIVEVEVFVQHKILHVLLVAIAIAASRQAMLDPTHATPATSPASGRGDLPPPIPHMEAAHAHLRP